MKAANPKRILLVNAHPDGGNHHLCDALADSYECGALVAGHEVTRRDLATLDMPLLKSKKEFEDGEVPYQLGNAADDLRSADHFVFVFPLWLGTMPALLKAWLEQTFRPGVAFEYLPDGRTANLLSGKSARVIVTMGMPAPIYRFWFLSHGVAGLRRNVLNFTGIKPVRQTYFGMIEQSSGTQRKQWLKTVRELGTRAI